jgi:hypothetical protein
MLLLRPAAWWPAELLPSWRSPFLTGCKQTVLPVRCCADEGWMNQVHRCCCCLAPEERLIRSS